MAVTKLNDAVDAALGRLMDSKTPEQWREHDEQIAAQREAERLEEVERDKHRRRSRLVDLGLPPKDLELVLGGTAYMSETQAMGEAQALLESGKVILVLSGERGCGKTTAASWWVAQAHKGGSQYLVSTRAMFRDASKLARQSRYDDKGMQDLERAEALVIDDLGIEYDDKSGATRSFFDALINSRYANMLPTVITTNLNGQQFKARYGERVADRIREAGKFVELSDKSMRGKVVSGG